MSLVLVWLARTRFYAARARPPGADGSALHVNSPHAEGQHPGRQTSDERQAKEPRQPARHGPSGTRTEPATELAQPESPERLDKAGRPFASALHLGQVAQTHPPGPKRFGQHVGRHDRVLDRVLK